MNQNRTAWLAGLTLAIFIVIFWGNRAPRPAETPTEPSDATTDVASQAPDVSNAEAASPVSDIAALEQALQIAVEWREQAEQQLDASERDVERLEAFVEEIRARGEDPADFADEGLEQFQPAFLRYEQAFAAFEEAERVEQLARARLAEARAAQSGTP